MTPEGGTSDASPNLSGGSGDAKLPSKDNKQRYRRRGGLKKNTPPTGRPVIRQPKFEGKCNDLKGHIYDCSDVRQSDIFVKTTKEIAEYAGHTFKKGSDARLAVENLSIPTLVPPTAPAGATDRSLNRVWEREIEEFVKRKTTLADNIQTVYSIVWGQCTDVMQQKVKALTNYDQLTTSPRAVTDWPS
jgi:hypothetical protein